jgi:membrane associated rhomboid family serine protease
MSLPQPPVVTTCYRHPDREAGRRCTRCGRPACSECLVQAAVGSHCLECAKAAKPSVQTRAKYWNARQFTLVTTVIMGINVLVFVAMVLADPKALGSRITDWHARLGLGKAILEVPVLITKDYVSQPHEWYRLVTSGFIHFGILHIGFNMLLLYQLGQLLERALGRLRFALLYLASLLGGSAGVIMLEGGHVGLSGGASGAVFGLMAAAAVGMHRRGINVFSTGIGTVFVLNLVLTFTIPGISIGAHVGGIVVGAICGWIMLAPAYRPLPPWSAWATPVALALLSVLISVAITA